MTSWPSFAPAGANAPLSRARALAAGGEWERLRRAAAADADGAEPEIGLLVAEAELRTGDPHAAGRRLPTVVAALERARDLVLLRRAVNLLGAAHFALGDLGAAEAAFERALALADRAGDHLLVARATNNLGAIANIRGHRERALSRYHHSVAAYQRVGSAIGLAETLHNMAITFRDLRRFEAADEYERRAIEFARAAGSARLVAVARAGRAELKLRQGDARLAEAAARIAADEFAAIHDPSSEADALRLVGAARTMLGDPGAALAALDRALALATTHGSALIEAEVLEARAHAAAAAGDTPRARSDGRRASEIFARLGVAYEDQAALEAWLASL